VKVVIRSLLVDVLQRPGLCSKNGPFGALQTPAPYRRSASQTGTIRTVRLRTHWAPLMRTPSMSFDVGGHRRTRHQDRVARGLEAWITVSVMQVADDAYWVEQDDEVLGFNRKIHVSHANTKTISIGADVIICQVDNVDIAARSCRLTFGAKTVNLNERAAQELYATMAEAGVPSEGAASKVSKSLSRLVCTVNPREIRERNGGGADCTFDVAAPK
jgi:hypothetical protein